MPNARETQKYQPREYMIGLAKEYGDSASILVAPCNFIGQYNSGLDSVGRKTGIRQLYDDAGITPPSFGHISRVVVQISNEGETSGKNKPYFKRVTIGEYTEAEIAEIRSNAGNNNIAVANDTAGYICSSCFQTGLQLENKRREETAAQTREFFRKARSKK